MPTATRWATGGVVPLHVIPLDEWTAIQPAGGSRAAAPYDENLPLLAVRRLHRRMRPALGLFVIDGLAVITVQPRGRRARARFVIWESASGVMRSSDLAVARPEDLLRVARRRGGRPARELRDLLRRPGGEPRELLVDVLSTLHLPGGELLSGTMIPAQVPGSVVVEPDRRAVSRFDDAVHAQVALRTELGLDR